MFNHCILLFSLLIFFFLIAQQTTAKESSKIEFGKVSCPEKWWAFTHPFIACRAKKITIKAREASREMMSDSSLDHDADGGQVDAFRHSYWMALLSQQISPSKAKR